MEELQVPAGVAIIVHLKPIKRNQYRTCSSKQSMQASERRMGQIVCLRVDEGQSPCAFLPVCFYIDCSADV